MRALVITLALAATACGRLHFGEVRGDGGGDGGGDDGGGSPHLTVIITGTGTGLITSSPPGISCPGTCDAPFPANTQITLTTTTDNASWFNGWTNAPCGGRLASCPFTFTATRLIGAQISPLPNRAFVTAAFTNGNIGGLAGADLMCSNAATAAGLGGTFLAFLSTSTVDARDRFAGSEGWIRTDGEPLADTMTGFIGGEMFSALTLAADATPVLVTTAGWTGSGLDGRVGGIGQCSNWTVTTGSGSSGAVRDMPPALINNVGDTCTTNDHLYCFESGRSVHVLPSPITGRTVFASRGTYASSGVVGVSGLDSMCMAEAQAAGLTGTFISLVATTTDSIETRAGTSFLSWVRPDGTRVANGGTAFFDGTQLLAGVNQYADGTYFPTGVLNLFTGAPSATALGTLAGTCDNWTSLVPASSPTSSALSVISADFWGATSGSSCNNSIGVLCGEQ